MPALGGSQPGVQRQVCTQKSDMHKMVGCGSRVGLAECWVRKQGRLLRRGDSRASSEEVTAGPQHPRRSLLKTGQYPSRRSCAGCGRRGWRARWGSPSGGMAEGCSSASPAYCAIVGQGLVFVRNQNCGSSPGTHREDHLSPRKAQGPRRNACCDPNLVALQ